MKDGATIEGKQVELTNLDKVLYPETGFTKAQVIDYYRRVAPFILPHLYRRPITLKRYPEGVSGEFFYEKTYPAYHPDWVDTSGGQGGIDIDFCLIDNLPSLIWAANLASIELHTLLARVEDLSRPTAVAFDLDPGPPATLVDCLDIALTMRDMLAGLGLKSFPKTSGGKGLHFFIPLNGEVTYDQTKYFAKTVARIMEKHYPERVTSIMAKSLREGKVLIDWSQNTGHKTMACVYTLRARARPTVSMPLHWEEVESAAARKDAGPLIYAPEQAIERLEKEGDIFEQVLTLVQELPAGLQKKAVPGSSKSEISNLRFGISGDGQRSELRRYREKRNFAKTPEPTGGPARSSERPVFVIQKHSATRVHYDLRLEVDGVLKSWSVPRGPSSDPADRRLAIQTEDHPLDYQDFEGVIPRGQYGAGQVIVWDHGTYQNVTGSPDNPVPMAEAIRDGKVEVFFEGNRIRGGYAFIRIHRADEEREDWLLIKIRDEYVGSLPEDLEDLPQSVVTGRTVKDLKRSAKMQKAR
jgi:bifunctional non-homologous end joining protein LigD